MVVETCTLVKLPYTSSTWAEMKITLLPRTPPITISSRKHSLVLVLSLSAESHTENSAHRERRIIYWLFIVSTQFFNLNSTSECWWSTNCLVGSFNTSVNSVVHDNSHQVKVTDECSLKSGTWRHESTCSFVHSSKLRVWSSQTIYRYRVVDSVNYETTST